jgi:hypothetical protein
MSHEMLLMASEVEVGETFIGANAANMHAGRSSGRTRRRGRPAAH